MSSWPANPVEAVAISESLPAPKSLGRRAVEDTFARPGARLGLAWLVLLAFAGAFAPFIANSHPIAMKMDGRWSSPMLDHLTSADVAISVVALTAIGLTLARFSFLRIVLTLLIELLIVVPLAIWLIHPPQTIVYEKYRELEREGRLEKVYRTIIPFSANDRLRDMPEKRLTGPSREHWLGTESSGADLLSRIIHASRIALAVGFISQGLSVLIGILVGGIMGYYVGAVDILGMRLIEVFEAIPRLFLLIAFTAFFGRNLYLMMIIIGLTGWTGDARFIRGEFFKLRNQDFVQAAVAAGIPTWGVLFRHMLPNGIAPVLVSSTFGVGGAILLESTLSFLGLGLIDEPSWGEMLNQARAGGVSFFWWIAIYPGLAIFLTVFAYILIGEAVRDALDPKLRGMRD